MNIGVFEDEVKLYEAVQRTCDVIAELWIINAFVVVNIIIGKIADLDRYLED